MKDSMNYEPKLRAIGVAGSLSSVAADRHKMLNELLAVIHRDGGQLTEKVGYTESCRLAEIKIVKLVGSIHIFGQHAERAIAKMDCDISPYNSINEILKLIEALK
jgi:hypothetical protein